MKPVNQCHSCGATSYKPVIKRDASGKMVSSGQYQCVGCRLVFSSLDEWRHGVTAQEQHPKTTY